MRRYPRRCSEPFVAKHESTAAAGLLPATPSSGVRADVRQPLVHDRERQRRLVELHGAGRASVNQITWFEASPSKLSIRFREANDWCELCMSSSVLEVVPPVDDRDVDVAPEDDPRRVGGVRCLHVPRRAAAQASRPRRGSAACSCGSTGPTWPGSSSRAPGRTGSPPAPCPSIPSSSRRVAFSFEELGRRDVPVVERLRDRTGRPRCPTAPSRSHRPRRRRRSAGRPSAST